LVIDFSSINIKETPVIVLRNIDGTALQTLGYAFNIALELNYNEVSVLSFDIPAYIDGVKTPHYDDIIGTRIVDVIGYGQFVLINPNISNDGIREVKSCKGYSLEYELTYKKMTLEEGTYNFWNTVAPNESIVGIILSYLPSWSVGSIDEDLIGKYRTFSVSNENIYNFIKSTVQKTYGCIFDFDTYNRKINVHSVSSEPSTVPIVLSQSNLIKDIEIEEDTENIFTVLDVNGADGVTIRSVNPTGTNKIYNLDYYMDTNHFSSEMIDKWNEWKTTCAYYQLPYYNLTIEKMLKTAEVVSKEHELTELTAVNLVSLENQQAVLIEFLAALSDTGSADYAKYQRDLATINTQITVLNSEIASCRNYVADLKSEEKALNNELIKINEETSFKKFFTDDELVILDRFFKEDSITDSSFVAKTAEAYIDDDRTHTIENTSFNFTNCKVTRVESMFGKEIYTIENGSLTSSDGLFSSNIISACIELKTDNSFVMTGHMGSGTIDGDKFISGCISVTGNGSDYANDAIPDASGIYTVGTFLSFNIYSAKLYFTQNTTEYERFSVEWDLYEYGHECLNRLSYPSYSFDISAANFLAIDEFNSFAKKLALGNKAYLILEEDRVLRPILVGVVINFEELSSAELKFGDTYNLSDSKFSLVDLLDKSISMGKTVDASRYNYNSFIDSGASTTVKEFINSALDVSKNAILSGTNMAVSWDSSGIKARKYTADGNGYEPEQIAIINNSIVFTDDAWQSAKMAIGHFVDTNLGDVWGIVAPHIAGTLLAGQNLVIESVKKDGGISVFRVDADGAVLHNARFDIENGVSHIVLDPTLGFGIGDYPIIKDDSWDENTAKFWVDTDGNLHFKGTLEGANGKFSGELSAATGSFSGAINGGSINIGNGNFVVDKDGNLTAKSGTFSGTVQGATYKDSTGNSMMDSGKFKSDYLNLKGLEITNNAGTTTLKIDSNGNVTLSGDISLASGSTINWANVTNENLSNNPAYSLANTANGNAAAANQNAGTALSTANNANTAAANASSAAATAQELAVKIANGKFAGGTFINEKAIYSPTIYADKFVVNPNTDNSHNSETDYGGFVLTGYYNDVLHEMLRIKYWDGGVPYVCFDSDCSAYAYWKFGATYFSGTVDFGSATVYGLNLTAKFG